MNAMKDIRRARPFRELAQRYKELSDETVFAARVPVEANHFYVPVVISIAKAANWNRELLPSRVQRVLYNLQHK